MAFKFNIGHALGGASKTLSNVIKTNEAVQAKADASLKEFTRTQNEIERRTAATYNREDQKQTENLRGQLFALGLTPSDINVILNQGSGFATGAVNTGNAYIKAGVSSRDLLVKPGDVIVPSTETQAAQIASEYSLKPPPKIETSAGFDKDISLLNMQILNATREELPELQRKLDATLASYRAMKKAMDISDGKTTTFNVASAINAARKPFFVAIGLEYDSLDGKVTGNIAGKKGELIIVDFKTANYLENAYKSLTNATMTDSIESLRKTGRRDLDLYANKMVLENTNNLGVTTAENNTKLFIVNSHENVINNVNSGLYNPGDVIIFRNDEGGMISGMPNYPIVFTNVPSTHPSRLGSLFEGGPN